VKLHYVEQDPGRICCPPPRMTMVGFRGISSERSIHSKAGGQDEIRLRRHRFM
jgi:hypothetical protein